MTKMIAFDLFGVVFTEGHMVSNGLMTFLPPDTDKAQVKHFYTQYTNGQIAEADFWQGIDVEDYVPLRQAFLDNFVLDDDLPAVIEALAGHYQLAILSNLASDWADYLIAKFDFEAIYSPIVISGKEGVGKPQRGIYDRLIHYSQLDAREIVFIDDRLENLATAHELGMQTVHCNREPDNHAFQPDHQIQRLSELSTIDFRVDNLNN